MHFISWHININGIFQGDTHEFDTLYSTLETRGWSFSGHTLAESLIYTVRNLVRRSSCSAVNVPISYTVAICLNLEAPLRFTWCCWPWEQKEIQLCGSFSPPLLSSSLPAVTCHSAWLRILIKQAVLISAQTDCHHIMSVEMSAVHCGHRYKWDVEHVCMWAA